MQIQYGNPDRLCLPLKEAKKTGKDLVVSRPCTSNKILDAVIFTISNIDMVVLD